MIKKKGKHRVNKHIQTALDYAYRLDYKEPPVSIQQFIEDEYYLGKVLNGGDLLFPIWHTVLKKVFEDDTKFLIVLTGAIGTGKTTAAIVAISYIMYRLLLLLDPWGYFDKDSSGKMAITFFNLTQSLGDSRGFGKLQAFLTASPWFLQESEAARRTRDRVEYLDFVLFRYLLASPYSKGFNTIGEDIVCGIMDEIDSPTESVKNKLRVLKAYENTVRRFDSRFVIDNASIGRLFLVASKQDDLSFLDAFVTKMKNSDRVLVFDIPLWESKPKHYFSGATFKVAYGDAFIAPKVVKEDDSQVELAKIGYKFIDVPEEFRDDFDRDVVGALRDLAGISVAGVRKRKLFPTERFVVECFDKDKQDPVQIPTVMLGLADEIRLIWYLDVNKIRMSDSIARYIHCDYGVTGDALGLSMCGLKEWKEIDTETLDGSFVRSKVPVVETDFVLRLKAKPGDRIPLHTVIRLVLDLRTAGYRIKFSADLRLASESMTQTLTRAGVPTQYISVDRDDRAYCEWRNLVFDKRWIFHKHEMVLFEARHLEHDTTAGKVDHPAEVKDVEILGDDIKDVVMTGSKDLTDAIVGALWSCLRDAKVPINVKLMTDLIGNMSETDRVPLVTKLLMPVDEEKKPIIGQASGNKIEILKAMIDRLK